MKLKGNNIFDSQISKLSVFRKINEKKNGGSFITSSPGLDHADLQRKRLVAFVRGIEVCGAGVAAGVACTNNEFTINVDTFDYDNLAFQLQRITSQGSSVVPMNHEMTELENHVKIRYGINEPGRYVLDIKYLDIPVPHSPFKINILRWNEAERVNGVVAQGKGLKRCLAGDIARFQLDTRKSGRGHISVVADSNSNNFEIPLCIVDSKSGYKVKYLVTSPGIFFLRIKFNGRHITGSPFMVEAENKREIPESVKNLLKRELFVVGSKEKKNDLEP